MEYFQCGCGRFLKLTSLRDLGKEEVRKSLIESGICEFTFKVDDSFVDIYCPCTKDKIRIRITPNPINSKDLTDCFNKTSVRVSGPSEVGWTPAPFSPPLI